MEAAKICLTAVLSAAELFILTKIMGKRQMSQLSLFDYINGITIGSIAAEMAFSAINECWKPALAMLVYGLFAVAFSFASNKSAAFRRIFVGKALILLNNGRLYRNNFAKSKLDLNEFLEQCRIGGYYNIDDLQTVIMEANGQLSFLPKSDRKPANPKDMGLSVQKEIPCAAVISDGKILQGNLEICGKNETWLKEQLKKNKYPPVHRIFLAMCDSNGKLTVYEINDEKRDKDIFC